jgi:hypothetical protein
LFLFNKRVRYWKWNISFGLYSQINVLRIHSSQVVARSCLVCAKWRYPINKYWGDLRQGGEAEQGKYTKEGKESEAINTTALMGAQ